LKEPFNAVISGLGNIAWLFDYKTKKNRHFLTHAFSYTNNNKTTLAGGCSPNLLERDKFQAEFKVPAYKTLNELINCTKPDIISLCSPSELHFKQTMHCIQSEIPMIWLEKPPATSLDELNQMIELKKQKKHKSKIIVNYQRRYSNQYQKLKTIYKQQTLGDCRLIQINYSRGLELNGSHMLDILFFITCDHENYKILWVSKEKQNPCFAMSLENNVMVIVTGTDLPYHNIDISITYENGRTSVIYSGIKTIIEHRVEQELFPEYYRLGEKSVSCCATIENEMETALNDLINAYQENREPLSNLVTAKNTQSLIDKVRLLQKDLKT